METTTVRLLTGEHRGALAYLTHHETSSGYSRVTLVKGDPLGSIEVHESEYVEMPKSNKVT